MLKNIHTFKFWRLHTVFEFSRDSSSSFQTVLDWDRGHSDSVAKKCMYNQVLSMHKNLSFLGYYIYYVSVPEQVSTSLSLGTNLVINLHTLLNRPTDQSQASSQKWDQSQASSQSWGQSQASSQRWGQSQPSSQSWGQSQASSESWDQSQASSQSWVAITGQFLKSEPLTGQQSQLVFIKRRPITDQ